MPTHATSAAQPAQASKSVTAAKLLKAEGEALCNQCHAEKTKKWEAEKNVHPALAMGCDSCHTPHGGPNPKLQKASGSDTCLACHEEKKADFAKPFGSLQIRNPKSYLLIFSSSTSKSRVAFGGITPPAPRSP